VSRFKDSYYTIKIWDITTGKLLEDIRGHEGSILSLDWSPDGKNLAGRTAADRVSIWDTADWSKIQTLRHRESPRAIAWHPDTFLLATGDDTGAVSRWVFERGKRFPPNAHSDRFLALDWFENPNRLVAGGGDNLAIIWDWNDTIYQEFKHENRVQAVAPSPDAKFLATGNNKGEIFIWDVEKGELALTLEGHTDRIMSLDWSPGGHYLLSGSYDQTVRVWGIE